MLNRRLISAAITLVGSAVGLILSAAHTKQEMIELRHEKFADLKKLKEKKMEKIYAGLLEVHSTPGSVLLDVREREDYDEGHIPAAVHADLRTLQFLGYPKETPLYIYCYRGNRSRMAAEILREAGFTHVKDIGGIDWYNGALES